MQKILYPILALGLMASCGGNKASEQPAAEAAAEEAYIDTLAANHPEYLPEVPLDTIAPDFAAPDTLGQTISLSNYRGQYVIGDFWATWCGDCRREVPELKALYDELQGQQLQGADIQFLSYSFDRDAEQWKAFLRKEQFAWPQISTLEPKWHDNVAAQAYRLHWIPAFLLVSPDGKLVGKAITVKGLRGELAKMK